MVTVADRLAELIRPIENWPAPGVTFRDITPLLADPEAFSACVDALAVEALSFGPVSRIAGVEARGFLFGVALAMKLGIGFVPVRKSGKLPADTIAREFDLEYGSATIEIHRDALEPGDRVLIVDDVLATGGTLLAAAGLVEDAGADVAGMLTVVDLPVLGGSAKLEAYSWACLKEF